MVLPSANISGSITWRGASSARVARVIGGAPAVHHVPPRYHETRGEGCTGYVRDRRRGVRRGVAHRSLSVAIAPPAEGGLVVVAITTYQGSVTQVSDSVTNLYHQTRAAPAIAGSGSRLWVYYADSVGHADPFSIVARIDKPSEIAIAAHEYRGITGLDQQSVASGDSERADSGQVMPTATGEVFFAAVAPNNTVTTSTTPDYVIRETAGTDSTFYPPLVTADKIGGVQAAAATFDFSASTGWAVALMTVQ